MLDVSILNLINFELPVPNSTQYKSKPQQENKTIEARIFWGFGQRLKNGVLGPATLRPITQNKILGIRMQAK